jgi:PAS domain S-box-containing protein
MHDNSKLLIIEDDKKAALELKKKTESFGYSVPRVILGGGNSLKILKIRNDKLPDLILINKKLKNKIKTIFNTSVKKGKPAVPVVYLVDKDEKRRRDTAVNSDSSVYLTKPFEDGELRYAIENSILKNTIEKKLVRINNFLCAIRRINHLIALKKNKEQLMKACCRDLVKIRGYDYVNIVLLDGNRNIRTSISAGTEKLKAKRERMIKKNNLPACYRKTLKNPDVLLVQKPSIQCGSCFLQNAYHGTWSMSIRLQFRRTVYGVLKITVNGKSIIEGEERELLKRLASDLAFAFNKLDLEQEQQGFITRLQQNEEKFHSLLESLHEGIWAIDKGAVTTYVNPRLAAILGYSVDEILGRRMVSFMEKEQQRRWETVFAQFPTDVKQEQIFKFRKKDGSKIYVKMIISPYMNRRGEYEGAIAGVEDITGQRELELEMLRLSRKEQERLGQTLHDSLGQLLTGIAFKNKVMEHRLQELQLPEWEEAAHITGLVNRAIEQTRILARGLLYFELDPGSFISGIKELIANMENLFNIKCELICEGRIVIRDKITAIQLYRIIQEAIHNAVKHGKATEIKISILRKEKSIVFAVIDNGTGDLQHLSRKKGLGMRIMQYRANTINASLEFLQNYGGGLKLLCIVAD